MVEQPEYGVWEWTDGWKNVQDDCMLCEMEQKTEWYLETRDWVVAEKLGGGPFIVSKEHKKELTDEEWDDMERIAGNVFDEFETEIIMAHCPNHWHGHLITDEDVDLSDE